MTPSTKFIALEEAIAGLDLKYCSVNFPVRHLEDGNFESKNGVTFRWSIDGAGYLSERNTRYKYAQFTRLVREERWVDLEMLANAAITPIKGAGQGLLFAIYNGEVVGILRHYNMVWHKDLLTSIKEAHLEYDVDGWRLTPQYMSVDLTVREAAGEFDEDDLLIALRVQNGHSGHHALSYKLLVKARGYEYSTPLYGQSRHLSGVSALVASLTGALKEVSQVRLDVKLKALSALQLMTTIRMLVPDMTTRQEALFHLLESSEVETGLDVFILLGQYASTKGYASAVSGLLDVVIEKMLDL